jgi:hypothetical protein
MTKALNFIKVKRVLKIDIKVEFFYLNIVLTRLRAPLI